MLSSLVMVGKTACSTVLSDGVYECETNTRERRRVSGQAQPLAGTTIQREIEIARGAVLIACVRAVALPNGDSSLAEEGGQVG